MREISLFVSQIRLFQFLFNIVIMCSVILYKKNSIGWLHYKTQTVAMISRMPYSLMRLARSYGNTSIYHINGRSIATMPSYYFHKHNQPTCSKFQRIIYFSSSGTTDPYKLLNVSRSSTAKEIKMAYFNEAKKCHPDLNPNDPKAKEKFQQISAAYELLSDEKRRRVYDATGSSQESYASSPGGSYGGAQNAQQHAEDIFNTVKEDVDVIKEAFVLYTEEVKEELQEAVDCARNQDWKGLFEIAKDHKFLIMGVVVPTVVFLRYPPAVFVVLRVLWAASNVALVGLLRSGNLSVAARTLWSAIVRLSREQRQRGKRARRR